MNVDKASQDIFEIQGIIRKFPARHSSPITGLELTERSARETVPRSVKSTRRPSTQDTLLVVYARPDKLLNSVLPVKSRSMITLLGRIRLEDKVPICRRLELSIVTELSRRVIIDAVDIGTDEGRHGNEKIIVSLGEGSISSYLVLRSGDKVSTLCDILTSCWPTMVTSHRPLSNGIRGASGIALWNKNRSQSGT